MKRQNEFKTRPMMVIPTVQIQPRQEQEPEPGAVTLSAFATSLWQRVSKKAVALASLGIGLFIGLVVLGWWLWPVEWTGMSYNELTPEDQSLLIEIASDLNAYDQNSMAVQELRQRWPDIDDLACFVASHPQVEETEKIRLLSLAYKVNNQGCP